MFRWRCLVLRASIFRVFTTLRPLSTHQHKTYPIEKTCKIKNPASLSFSATISHLSLNILQASFPKLCLPTYNHLHMLRCYNHSIHPCRRYPSFCQFQVCPHIEEIKDQNISVLFGGREHVDSKSTPPLPWKAPVAWCLLGAPTVLIFTEGDRA